MVIWITGLSGAGKSTLCRELSRRLKPVAPQLVVLDGDEVREAFGDGLGFTEPDRHVQIRRVQRLARLLSSQGLLVLVAVVYANDELLAWNRTHIPGYVEIYLRASLELLARRDSKGLYGRAARGDTRDVVGLDIPWHAPAAPDLVLDADSAETSEVFADRVIATVPALARLLEVA